MCPAEGATASVRSPAFGRLFPRTYLRKDLYNVYVILVYAEAREG